MMKKISSSSVALVFTCSFLLLASCAKQQVKSEEEITKPPTTAPRGTAPTTRKAEPPTAVDRGAERRAEAERQAKEDEQAKARRLQNEIRIFESDHIYFDFDKAELKPEARASLVRKADWLRDNPQYSLLIEGHCDERGTNEYNLALGERRANTAWKFLNALGISGDRLSTISYGEERPVDSGHHSDAWNKNRRDEFKLIR